MSNKYGAKVFKQKGKTMRESRRQVIKECVERDNSIIVYTEIEKVGLIKYIDKLSQPIIWEGVDMVIPARETMLSYPIIQQYAEPIGNLVWKI